MNSLIGFSAIVAFFIIGVGIVALVSDFANACYQRAKRNAQKREWRRIREQDLINREEHVEVLEGSK